MNRAARSPRLLDAVMGCLTCLAAAIPLAAVFGGVTWAVVLLGGLLAGFGTVEAGRRLTWLPVVTAVALAGAYVVLAAGVVAMTLPGVFDLRTVLTDAVTASPAAWRTLVVQPPPVGGLEGLLVVPLQIGVLAGAGLAASSAALRPLILAVPFAVLVAGILLGLDSDATAIPAAMITAAATTVWAVGRGSLGGARRLLLVALVGVLATGGTAAAAATGLVPSPAQRFVLRDVIEPDVDVSAYPSPLAGFRKWSKVHSSDVLFTVSGLPAGTPLRLAALDSYDGVTWNVSGAGMSSSGRFGSVAQEVAPDPFVFGAGPGETADVVIDIVDYTGVWLPTVGYSEQIDVDGDRSAAVRNSLLYNAFSGTGVVPVQLREGDRLRLRAGVPTVAGSVAGSAAADLAQPEPRTVPNSIPTMAGDLAAAESLPYRRAQALADGLADGGYYSSGAAGSVASPPGHGADRMALLLNGDAMIGDEEQYAAAMALMARSLGLSSRVVMGFLPGAGTPAAGAGATAPAPPDQPVQVHGADVTAWVEIAFDGQGWVPFYPTPDRAKAPPTDATRPQQQQRPQVQLPPPPVRDVRAAAPISGTDVEEDADDPTDPARRRLTAPWAAAIAGGGGLLALAAPGIAILVAKHARRRRRRRLGRAADRLAGGWDEAMDAIADLGVAPPPRATRREAALAVRADGSALALAMRADEAVFSGEDPTAAEIERFWADVDTAIGRWRRERPWHKRMAAQLSMRSLRGRS